MLMFMLVLMFMSHCKPGLTLQSSYGGIEGNTYSPGGPHANFYYFFKCFELGIVFSNGAYNYSISIVN